MQSTLQLQWFMRANEPTGKAILQEQKTPIWKRKFAVPYSVAAAAVVLMFFSASLFFGQQAPPATVVNTLQKEYVYVTALPPVDVVASPLPEKKNN